MIRKMTIRFILAFCIVALPSMARTRPAITIGGNYWYAQRDLSGEYWTDIKSKAGNMFGPYASIRLGKWLFGSSMFFGTFSEYGIHDELYERKYSFANKRSDLNFSLGYAIHNRVNVFAALKNLSFNADEEERSTYDIDGDTWYGKRKIVDKGTMFGGGASGLFRSSKSPLFLYWSAAYLIGSRTTSDRVTSVEGQTVDYSPDFKTDNSITALSAGIGIQTRAGITVLAGYRADILNFKTDTQNMNGKENLNGVSITLAYTLR